MYNRRYRPDQPAYPHQHTLRQWAGPRAPVGLPSQQNLHFALMENNNDINQVMNNYGPSIVAGIASHDEGYYEPYVIEAANRILNQKIIELVQHYNHQYPTLESVLTNFPPEVIAAMATDDGYYYRPDVIRVARSMLNRTMVDFVTRSTPKRSTPKRKN
jgi:hypothetical protein